jgi:hypothetical protein
MTDTKDLHRQLNAAIRREFDARQAGAVSAQQMAMDEIRRLRRLIILQAKDDHLAQALGQLKTRGGG